LLVVSTSAPTTFYQMWLLIKDAPAFIVSYGLIMMAWYFHFLFYRRFGLEDTLTNLINSLFLFCVMFFAYPLKFLCSFLWHLVIGESVTQLFALPQSVNANFLSVGSDPELFQRVSMMYMYGFGLIGLFLSLALLQLRALRLKEQLELDKLEVISTVKALTHHLINVFMAIISLSVLKISGNAGVSGIIYFGLPFMHMAVSFSFKSKIKTARSL